MAEDTRQLPEPELDRQFLQDYAHPLLALTANKQLNTPNHRDSLLFTADQEAFHTGSADRLSPAILPMVGVAVEMHHCKDEDAVRLF